ncbi:MAG: LysR family transcriptional regulator [Anaerovoracaceae bacterium]|jgi:DNA-binding transcriptional LysR family regulator
MESRKYEAVIRIAENGSITKTAEEMGYTQSGITQMLNSLEEELGLKLFARTNKGAVATPEGAYLLPFFREEQIWEERILQECSALQGVVAGEIRIGSLTSIAGALLPAVAGAFHSEYPDVKIRVLAMGDVELRDSLISRKTDVIFLDMTVMGKCEVEFPVRHLFNDEIFAVVPKGNPLARRKSVTLEELAEYPFLENTSSLDESFSNLNYIGDKAEELDLYTRFKIDDDLMLINMIQNNMGVSLAGETLVMNYPGKVASVSLEPKRYRPIAIGVMSEKHLSPVVKAFLETTDVVIKEEVPKMREKVKR